jgi:hypothetical protein
MAASYEFKHIRCTITGTMFSGAESWSTGFQLGQVGTDVDDVVTGTAEQVAGHWQTFFSSPSTSISIGYKTVEVKLALINLNGKTNLDEIDYWTYPSPIEGGSTAQALPPQITLAATLTSDFQRGLASKGRMYIPGMTLPISGTNGKLTATQTNTLNTNFKTFLDGINADGDIPYNVVIASKGHKTQTLDEDGQPVYENGRQALVTGCRIGDVYDTQRRRRNDFIETYNAKVLA